MLNVILTESCTGKNVGISPTGGLAVGPPQSSVSFNATLAVDDTKYEIVPPKASKTFNITGIILTGNKNISSTVDATVTIYEADATDVDTSINDILVIPIGRSAQSVLTGMSLQTREAVHIMGVTTDDDVLVTILGYYVDA